MTDDLFPWRDLSTSDADPVKGWQVSWKPINGRPFDTEHEPAARLRSFRRHEAAEAHKLYLEQRFPGEMVVCMKANGESPRAREKRFQGKQTSLADQWPIQMKRTGQ